MYSDYSGYYEFSTYACLFLVRISAQNFQDTSFYVQIYPDSTVIRNIVLQSLEAIHLQPDNIVPSQYYLSQNHPNPFNPTTTIKYGLPKESKVTLKIFNILGQEVATLVDEHQPAGYHQITWDAAGHSSGIYFYKIQAGEFQKIRKMILLK